MPEGQGRRPRRGPLENAIENRDSAVFIALIKDRCVINELLADPCWLWTGARNTSGYAYMGRAGSYRAIHRVMAWASAGFPGDIHDLPQVHHMCGIRGCVNPSHLAPVTAYRNVLEQAVRNALLDRIQALTAALKAVEPSHKLLFQDWAHFDEQTRPLPARAITHESPRVQMRRLERRTAYAARRQLHQEARFRQVIEVNALLRQGASKGEACERVGMSKTAYEDWQPRWVQWLEEQAR